MPTQNPRPPPIIIILTHARPIPLIEFSQSVIHAARTQEGRRHEGRDQKEGDSHPALAYWCGVWECGGQGREFGRVGAVVRCRPGPRPASRRGQHPKRERIPPPSRGRRAAIQLPGAPIAVKYQRFSAQSRREGSVWGPCHPRTGSPRVCLKSLHVEGHCLALAASGHLPPAASSSRLACSNLRRPR